jgi:hypothetical protein
MPTLNYQQNLTGVQVPRSEVLNSRPWAVVKLIGFIIALVVVVAAILLAGAMLGGARPRFHLERSAGEQRQTGQVDFRQEIQQVLKEFLRGHQAQQATPPSAPAAPAAPTAPASAVTVSLPEIRVVLTPDNRQPEPAPDSGNEAPEQDSSVYLLTEGEDP